MNILNYSSVKYLKRLFEVIISLSRNKEELAYYRIIDPPAMLPEEDVKKIFFQVVGTSLVLKSLPEDIMRDNLLFGFNRVDIAVITHLGTKNESRIFIDINKTTENFQLIQEVIDNGNKRFIVEQDGERHEYEASDLYEKSNIIKKLNGIDGMKIGFSIAEDHQKRTNNIIKN